MTSVAAPTQEAPPHPFVYHPEGKPPYFVYQRQVDTPNSGQRRTLDMRIEPKDSYFEFFKALHDRCQHFEEATANLQRERDDLAVILEETQAEMRELRSRLEGSQDGGKKHVKRQP